MDSPEPVPESIPDPPSRSDLNLFALALRNDWPIPPAVRTRLLQLAINLADPAEEDELPADLVGLGGPLGRRADERISLAAKRDRTKLAAHRVIVQYERLTLLQQRLDDDRAVRNPVPVTDGAGGQTRLDMSTLTDEQLMLIIEGNP